MKECLGKILMVLMLATTCLQAVERDESFSIETPYTQSYLQVSEKHQIFYAAYGNPKGVPVVILHGGPGVGCGDDYTRYFDLNYWHVVMFDQRGAMRSKPFGCMEQNTTQDSVADIEALRKYLEIEQWVVFGHSWGSCLGIIYGETYPTACLGFILEGTFLGREEDIGFFRDMGKISASAHQELLTHFTQEEQKDIPAACYQRVMDPNPEVHMAMARALMQYQMLNTPTPPSAEILQRVLANDRYVLSFMRAFIHYATHHCFLQPNQALANIDEISHIPAIIVHGSLDVVCLPRQAYLLHQNWENSQLWMIEGGAHSCRDPAIVNALVKATNAFKISLQVSKPLN